MPFYTRLGQIPHKRHTQFRKPDGELYREEVMGLEGFSGLESILYHHFLPPRVQQVKDLGPDNSRVLRLSGHFNIVHSKLPSLNGWKCSNCTQGVAGQQDVTLGLSTPDESMEEYYRNSQAYEVWFTHQGAGELKDTIWESSIPCRRLSSDSVRNHLADAIKSSLSVLCD